MEQEQNKKKPTPFAVKVKNLENKVKKLEELVERMADGASQNTKTISILNSHIQRLENPKQAVIEIMPLDPTDSFIIPEPAKDGSIGDDLITTKDIWLRYGRNIVPTNICINLPRFIEGKIEPRSGFSAKGILGTATKLVSDRLLWIFRKPAVEVSVTDRMNADVIDGKIDPGYHDGIGIIIKNNGVPFMIPAGTHLAQITYYKTVPHRYKRVEAFSTEAPYVENRQGGFGSSDTPQE